jgi:hypothetical protein
MTSTRASTARQMPKFVRLESLESLQFLVSGTKSDVYTAIWNGKKVAVKVINDHW